jgi:hypothetical protein
MHTRTRARAHTHTHIQERRELEMLHSQLQLAEAGGGAGRSGGEGGSEDDGGEEGYGRGGVERVDTVAAVAGDDERFRLSDDDEADPAGPGPGGAPKGKSRKCGIGITFRCGAACARGGRPV